MAANFAAFDAAWPGAYLGYSKDDYHDSCGFTVDTFEEDASVLLLSGEISCLYRACSGPGPMMGSIVATSSDGLTWVDAPSLPPNTQDVSGGSSGFIGLSSAGSSGSTAAVVVSQDGRTWAKRVLPPELSLPGSSLGNAVAINGGFVMSGVVLVRKRPPGDELAGGCSGQDFANRSRYQGAVWWSPDGTNWTREALSGVPNSPGDAYIHAIRIDDKTVILDESIWPPNGDDTQEVQWASTDGKTWTRLAYSGFDVVNNRDRGFEVNIRQDGQDLMTLDKRYKVIKLKQSGWVPSLYDGNLNIVVGPTGFLATENCVRFWLGVPSAK
jgi:hypothetical protein